MLCYENPVSIVWGKLLASIKAHPERRHMGRQLKRGRRELRARLAGAKLWIAHVTPMAVRIAKVQFAAARMIQLIGGARCCRARLARYRRTKALG